MVRMTSDANLILDAIVGDDPAERIGLAEAELNMEIAQIIYDARESSGVSQRELARRMGTSQSAISRQECLDYRGHTISMLARMLAAMDLELVVGVRPLAKPTARAAAGKAKSAKITKPASKIVKPASKVAKSGGTATTPGHRIAAKGR